MTTDLAIAVEDLYTTFADYRLESPSPCPTCYPPAEVLRIERRMRTTPLRSLTLDDLSHFYADGVLTWGGVNDLRHLLPRLMELFAAYHLGKVVAWSGDRIRLRLDLDPDIALLRFVDAEWWAWPQVERDAVEAFFLALWRSYLSMEMEALPRGHWFDEDLPEALLRTTSDAAPYLTAWRSSDWAGTRHLAWFITNDSLTSWLTWEDAEQPSTMPNWVQVRSWLGEPETAAQLEDAARQGAPRDQAFEAFLGLEVLRRGRVAVPWSGARWHWDDESVRRADALGVLLPDEPED